MKTKHLFIFSAIMSFLYFLTGTIDYFNGRPIENWFLSKCNNPLCELVVSIIYSQSYLKGVLFRLFLGDTDAAFIIGQILVFIVLTIFLWITLEIIKKLIKKIKQFAKGNYEWGINRKTKKILIFFAIASFLYFLIGTIDYLSGLPLENWLYYEFYGNSFCEYAIEIFYSRAYSHGIFLSIFFGYTDAAFIIGQILVFLFFNFSLWIILDTINVYSKKS